jgi:hypothetical protein
VQRAEVAVIGCWLILQLMLHRLRVDTLFPTVFWRLGGIRILAYLRECVLAAITARPDELLLLSNRGDGPIRPTSVCIACAYNRRSHNIIFSVGLIVHATIGSQQ